MKTTGMGWRARAALALIAGLAAGAANAQGMQQAAPAQSAPKQQSAGSPSASNGSTSNPSAPQQKLYKNEELDQMMAPVALYPDSVLSQLLMACTYPSDVAE